MQINTALLLAASLITSSSQCKTDEDCNLNGICSPSNTCVCDPGWTAADCGALNVQPAPRNNGYNRTSEHVSSWGSKIVRDPRQQGLYHAFLAEFTHHCGLDYWSPYSRIIRSTSNTGPLGPYAFAESVVAHFAHNPTVVYSSQEQEYLMYYVGCSQAVNDTCTAPSFTCGPGNTINGESGISLQTSKDLLTWQFKGQVFPGMNNGAWDADTTNPSPLETGVYPGSVWSGIQHGVPSRDKIEQLLAYRGCPFNCSVDGGELISIASAPNPLGPYTRLNDHKPIFPNTAEDPFFWRDKRGNHHLLVHSLEKDGGFGSGPNVGRHAYARSVDGPWYFNKKTLAFSTEVQFDDGTSINYYRRERPQLLFSDNGAMTPLVLSTGVQEVNSSISYSIMVPIGQQFE